MHIPLVPKLIAFGSHVCPLKPTLGPAELHYPQVWYSVQLQKTPMLQAWPERLLTHVGLPLVIQASPPRPGDSYFCLTPTLEQATLPVFSPTFSGLLKTLPVVDKFHLPISDTGSFNHNQLANSTYLPLAPGSSDCSRWAVIHTYTSPGS